MDMDNLILERLAFERNDNYLFHNLNYHLLPGEICQVQGQNGSGKTTLLRVLAGFIEPREGEIYWKGRAIAQDRDSYVNSIHYIGHLNGIKSNLTVYENLKLFTKLIGYTNTSYQLNIIINKFGLTNYSHTQANYLSAGQCRRLSLTRLLLQPRPLWILDEPTTTLDSEGEALLNSLLREHMANRGIAIIATHQPLVLSKPVKTIDLGKDHHD